MNDILRQIEYCAPIGIISLVVALMLGGIVYIVETHDPTAIVVVCTCVFCVLIGLAAMALRRWLYGKTV